jgi:hypothetical protein
LVLEAPRHNEEASVGVLKLAAVNEALHQQEWLLVAEAQVERCAWL